MVFADRYTKRGKSDINITLTNENAHKTFTEWWNTKKSNPHCHNDDMAQQAFAAGVIATKKR